MIGDLQRLLSAHATELRFTYVLQVISKNAITWIDLFGGKWKSTSGFWAKNIGSKICKVYFSKN